MKMYMKVSVLFALFCSSIAFSQIADKAAIGFAYRYIGRSVLQGGLQYKLNDSRSTSYIVGASVIYTLVNEKNKLVPEVNFNYTLEKGLLLGVSANTYSFEPRVGISILNLAWLNAGYSIPYDKEKYFQGFTCGIQLNLGGNHFYNRLKFF